MIRSDDCSPPILLSRSRRPGGQPGELAFALVGLGGHVDGGGERRFEFLEAAAVAADFGEIVEPPFGILDLVARREVDRRVERAVDHVLADLDQLAPDREVVDRAAIVGRVDDGGRFRREAGEILRDRHAGDVDVGRHERLQRHRRRELAGADQAARDVVELLVDGLEEMFRLEEIGDAIERLVIDEDRAQQRLLRLDIVRCDAIGRGGFLHPLARG